jgi:hypothetical protein
MRPNLFARLAFIALVSVPGTALTQSATSDWSDNASASLTNQNLSRAFLVEQLENGFFQDAPDYNSTYNYSWYDQQSVGNMTMTDVQVSESCRQDNMQQCSVTVHTHQGTDQANHHSGQQSSSGDNAGQTAQSTAGNGANTSSGNDTNM